MTTNKYYDRLVEIHAQYPELTLVPRRAYEYLSREIQDNHKEQIEEVTEILRNTVAGFSEFNNFKPGKDGDIVIRCQYRWTSMFTGVGYFSLESFKNFKEESDEEE